MEHVSNGTRCFLILFSCQMENPFISRPACYKSLYNASPERGSFFRLQLYESVGISTVEVCIEVYERAGKLSFRSVKRASLNAHFLSVNL